MVTRRLIILFSALMIAGCSASSGSGDESGSGNETVESLAATLGCSATLVRDGADDRERFVTDSATCTIGGESIVIKDFGTPESSENWWAAAKKFGANPDQGVTVGAIFVRPDSPDMVDAVRGTLVDGSPPPTSAPTTSEAEEAALFLEAVQNLAPELVTGIPEHDDALVEMGRSLCSAWDDGATAQEVLEKFASTDLTQDQSFAIIAATPDELCPEYNRP